MLSCPREDLISMTLFKRSTALRLTTLALSTAALAGAAFAQTISTPIGDLNSSQQVIHVSAGADITAEAAVDTISFTGTFTTPYVTSSPVVFFWINMTTNQPEFAGMDYSETCPSHSTRYWLIAENMDNGDWGQAFMNITVTDHTPPQIWLLGQPTMLVQGGTPWIDPGFGVFDNEDGVSVPVTITGSVNTNAVGVYTLTYTATDSHNNSASVTRTVDVFYNWSGFSQPVNMDGSSVFHINSTIPLKFTLTGGNASNSAITAKLYLAKMSDGIAGTDMEASSTGAADIGNTFRFQNGTYTYNLDSKGLTSGTWQLTVDMGDGALHTAVISLTK